MNVNRKNGSSIFRLCYFSLNIKPTPQKDQWKRSICKLSHLRITTITLKHTLHLDKAQEE